MFSRQDVPYSTAFSETVYATGADNNPKTVKEGASGIRIHITSIVISPSANIQIWFTDEDDTNLVRTIFCKANETVELKFDKETPITVTANKDVVATANVSSAFTVTMNGYTD